MQKEMTDTKENGCKIFSVEMDGNNAHVDFQTVCGGTIVVALYTEDGKKLITSGEGDIKQGDKDTVIKIDGDIPEYFYLRAYIVDYELAPLSKVYESPNYTKEMQEFFATTINDFDQDLILNLDSNEKNNFLVYDKSVVRIKEQDSAVKLETEEENELKYTFSNANITMKNLKEGDILSYENIEGRVIIIAVKSIESEGDYVTVYGVKTDIESVFEFVKIDSEARQEDITIENTGSCDGVVYKGRDEIESKEGSQEEEINGWDGKHSLGGGFKYDLVDYKTEADGSPMSGKINGSISLNFTGKIEYYITWSQWYLEVSIGYEIKGEVSVTDKFKASIPLVSKFGISPVLGVIIEFTPSFVFEISGKAKLSFKMTQTASFKAGSDVNGGVNISNPKVEIDFSGEIELFIGLSLEPKIIIIADWIANAKLKAEGGCKIKGKLSTKKESNIIHDCETCVDGEMRAIIKGEVSGCILNSDKLKFEIKMDLADFKIADWYYSFDHNEFGWNKSCPHKKYKVDFEVKDTNGNSIQSANLNFISGDYYVQENGKLSQKNSLLTNEQGKITGYQKEGAYSINIKKDGYKKNTKFYCVEGKPRTIKIQLKTDASTPSPSGSVHNPRLNADGSVTYSTVYFGNYWQNDTDGDGFSYEGSDNKEPIQWRVLSVNGDDLYLLSDKLIECAPYNMYEEDVTWEICSMRSWLNGYGTSSNIDGLDFTTYNFIDYAFNSTEKNAIKTTHLVNEDNSIWKTEGGNDTNDKLFLLSEADIKNTAYGFSSNYGKDPIRKAKSTLYTDCNRADGWDGERVCWWWLRSPGANAGIALIVDDDGCCHDNYENELSGFFYTVRPALHLSSSSKLYTVGSDITVGASSSNTNQLMDTMCEDVRLGSVSDVIYAADVRNDSENGCVADFTGLGKEKIYNLYVVKNEDDKDLLTSENLLYIAQGRSGADGKMSFTYMPKEIVEGAVVFVKKMRDSLEDEEDNTGLEEQGMLIKTIRVGDEEYKVKYTAEVVYNGVNHIQKGGKTSKTKVGDIDVVLYDPNGKEVSPSDYKLTFKNNKNAVGSKTPYFTAKLKGKVDKNIKQAFKDTKMEFTITPCDISNLKLSEYKIKEKNGTLKISGLSYVNETGKKIKLKQAGKTGKGDFKIEGTDKDNYTICGINNYCNSVKVGKSGSGDDSKPDPIPIPDPIPTPDPIVDTGNIKNPKLSEDNSVTYSTVFFGNYWQNDTNQDGTADKNDAKEPIRWRVLKVENGEMLLLADQNLDGRLYHEIVKNTEGDFAEVSWERSTARSWLNSYDAETNDNRSDYTDDGFISNAFSSDERADIITSRLKSLDNETIINDKLFFLSEEDIINSEYGFSSDLYEYDDARDSRNTAFASEQHAYYMSSGYYEESAFWLLRAPFGAVQMIPMIGRGGQFYRIGYGDMEIGVRPALRLPLTSKSYSVGDEIVIEKSGRSRDSTDDPAGGDPSGRLKNPEKNADGSVTYSTVYFGNYWQKITDPHKFVYRDEDKEPIRWRVLWVGRDDIYLLSDLNLDCRPYNESAMDGDGNDRVVIWKNSTIRSWLNGYNSDMNVDAIDYTTDNFYDRAFSDDEKAVIKKSVLQNYDNKKFLTEDDTSSSSDKIFLLNKADICNKGYGFSFDPDKADPARVGRNSAVTKFMGACDYDDAGAGTWWLRSSGDQSNYVMSAKYDGSIKQVGDIVTVGSYGVRPAMHIKRETDLYTVGEEITVNAQ